MANIKSEQLTSDLNLEIELDQPLSQKEIESEIKSALGGNDFSYVNYGSKRLLCYKETIVFLTAATTYVGGTGQHPIFKKRTQLPNWWKQFTLENKQYNVRFIGVYHYKRNVIFIDYEKDTFIRRKMNNSSAFIYTNDLYQAMRDGIFYRLDTKGNSRYIIRKNKLFEYINNLLNKYEPVTIDDFLSANSITLKKNSLFDIFDSFNKTFDFDEKINIVDSLKYMNINKDYSFIRLTEWAGSYLECKFKHFIDEIKCENKVKYIGKAHKKKGELDFDLWFCEEQFFGDLKASSINKSVAPGNDKNDLMDTISKFDKFWYVIYEHETENESPIELEAVKLRKQYLESIGQWKKPKKYGNKKHRCLKLNVNFQSMMILELNRVNCRQILSDFNQGRQPNGKPRKVKVNINKRNIENFIVFRYSVFDSI